LLCGAFSSLADRLGHFAIARYRRLPAIIVANDYDRAETEMATAFDHFGNAGDIHDTLVKLRTFILISVARTPIARTTSAWTTATTLTTTTT
jgi:hypothetical protein